MIYLAKRSPINITQLKMKKDFLCTHRPVQSGNSPESYPQLCGRTHAEVSTSYIDPHLQQTLDLLNFKYPYPYPCHYASLQHQQASPENMPAVQSCAAGRVMADLYLFLLSIKSTPSPQCHPQLYSRLPAVSLLPFLSLYPVDHTVLSLKPLFPYSLLYTSLLLQQALYSLEIHMALQPRKLLTLNSSPCLQIHTPGLTSISVAVYLLQPPLTLPLFLGD